MAEEMKEIPTNYSRNYAETRGWGDWEIVREFVQNSLDATGCASIEKNDDRLFITDNGRGFNALNLLMGTTTKSECDRGRFGEGLKIACLAALNLGYELEIYTDSMFVKPVFKTLIIEDPTQGKLQAEVMSFKYKKIQPFGGTRIFIKGYKGETYQDRFNFETNKKIFLKKDLDECEDKLYPSYIIDELEKRIYVRNIYVQDIETPALFSYDLFNVRLSTDRNIPNTSDVHRQVGKLWSAVTDTPTIEKFLNHIRTETYEATISLDSFVIENHGSKSAWTVAFRNLFGNGFLYTDEDTTKLAEYNSHFLRKGIYLPTGTRYALQRIDIPTDREILAMYANRAPPETTWDLDDVTGANFEYLRLIHFKLKEKHYPKLANVYLATEKSMGDSGGRVVMDDIYIRVDQAKNMVDLLDTYGHETTHVAYPELQDNTSDFYSKIGQVMAFITKVIVQENIRIPKNVVW